MRDHYRPLCWAAVLMSGWFALLGTAFAAMSGFKLRQPPDPRLSPDLRARERGRTAIAAGFLLVAPVFLVVGLIGLWRHW